jgi:hypothetical protein
VKTDPDVLQEPGLPPAALPDTPAASDDDVAHEAAWLRLGMIVMLALFAVSMLVILGRLAWRRARTPRVGRLSRSAQRLRRRGALIQARRRLFSALERKDLELADDQLHRYLELRYACSRSAAEALFRAEGGGEVLRRLAGARFASPLLPAPAATEMRAALDGLRVRARPQPEALPPLFGYRDNISSRDKVGSRDERDRNSRQETVTPRFS